MIEYLNLDVYGQAMLVDIYSVDIVSQLVLVHPVPRNIVGLEGVINYRGDIVNVVSLSSLLGMEKNLIYSEDDNIVICGDGKNRICLIVKEACDIILRDESELHSEHQSKFIKGVYVDYDKDYWVIDTNCLISSFSNSTMAI